MDKSDLILKLESKEISVGFGEKRVVISKSPTLKMKNYIERNLSEIIGETDILLIHLVINGTGIYTAGEGERILTASIKYTPLTIISNSAYTQGELKSLETRHRITSKEGFFNLYYINQLSNIKR